MVKNPYPQFTIDEVSEVRVVNPSWQAWEEGRQAGESAAFENTAVKLVNIREEVVSVIRRDNATLQEENANLRTALVNEMARVHALEEARPVDGKVPGRLYIELVRRDGKLRLELVKYERGIPK
jgi:hypothetical protein